MNKKNTVLITLALGLALSTGMTFCMKANEEPKEEITIEKTKTPDTSYFQWRSKAAAFKKRLFGESAYPGAALGGAMLGVGVTTTTSAINWLVTALATASSDRQIRQITLQAAKDLALPTAVAGAVIGATLGLVRQYDIEREPVLIQAANEKLIEMMPVVIAKFKKLIEIAETIDGFAAYEKCEYKNLFKSIYEREIKELKTETK